MNFFHALAEVFLLLIVFRFAKRIDTYRKVSSGASRFWAAAEAFHVTTTFTLI